MALCKVLQPELTLIPRVDNTISTRTVYRIAKTALNQGAATMAREWKNEGRKAAMICVGPGYVPTWLTRWEGDNGMDTCIAGLMELFKNITLVDNGGFSSRGMGTSFLFSETSSVRR